MLYCLNESSVFVCILLVLFVLPCIIYCCAYICVNYGTGVAIREIVS
jgi:hypothetical protein